MDPWFRINRWHTLSSYRHEACRDEPTAPRDYLDFVLKSEYNHTHEFLKSKAEVLLQRDTLNKLHKSVTIAASDMVYENCETQTRPRHSIPSIHSC